MLEQELDETAIKYGLGTSTVMVIKIVPVLGQRLKVHNDLRTLCMQDEELSSSEQIQEVGICVCKGEYSKVMLRHAVCCK